MDGITNKEDSAFSLELHGVNDKVGDPNTRLLVEFNLNRDVTLVTR